MKTIQGKVVSYLDIPQDLIQLPENQWLSKYLPGCYVEVHIAGNTNPDGLDLWLMDKYPGIEEETFYIEIP